MRKIIFIVIMFLMAIATAQGTVTLAQSQDYTLIGGTVDEGVFGNVIQFNNLTTRSIYDKTAGVDLTLTCS